MAKVSGGALAAQVMKNDGVKHLFGLIGGHVFRIFEGCVEMGIRIIDVRHEESAAHMAEGWALATGKPGVCIATAGPGFTNLLTGIANSSSGGTPLLALGGHASIDEFDTGSMQDFNQIDIVKPMTKFARVVYEVERIPEYMGMAFRHATSGRPGPVYLEIPKDLTLAIRFDNQAAMDILARSGDFPQVCISGHDVAPIPILHDVPKGIAGTLLPNQLVPDLVAIQIQLDQDRARRAASHGLNAGDDNIPSGG